jgi:hypothetical protein
MVTFACIFGAFIFLALIVFSLLVLVLYDRKWDSSVQMRTKQNIGLRWAKEDVPIPVLFSKPEQCPIGLLLALKEAIFGITDAGGPCMLLLVDPEENLRYRLDCPQAISIKYQDAGDDMLASIATDLQYNTQTGVIAQATVTYTSKFLEQPYSRWEMLFVHELLHCLGISQFRDPAMLAKSSLASKDRRGITKTEVELLNIIYGEINK